jgi:hypothetical protein
LVAIIATLILLLIAVAVSTLVVRLRVQTADNRVDRQLVPTGHTDQLPKTDTCIPLRQVVHFGGNNEPAVCHQRDEARLATARGGLVVAAAGIVLMVLVGAAGAAIDRLATRRAPRPRSTPAPR